MQLFCKLHALVSIALVGLGIMVGASILYEYHCLDDCNKWNMYHTLSEDAPEDPYLYPTVVSESQTTLHPQTLQPYGPKPTARSSKP